MKKFMTLALMMVALSSAAADNNRFAQTSEKYPSWPVPEEFPSWPLNEARWPQHPSWPEA